MNIEITKFVKQNEPAIISFWKDLVSMESGFLCKEELDKTCLFLKEAFEKIGGDVTIYPFDKAGNTLTAVFGDIPNKAPIILSGHYDTVFSKGTLEKRPFVIKNGKAYGPGVLDMKGGITILYYVLQTLHHIGYTDRVIKVILTGDEENSHPNSTAPHYVEEIAKGARAAFNFETSFENNLIVTARKGTACLTVEIEGRGAHPGNDPEKGRNTILEAVQKIPDIQALNGKIEHVTFTIATIAGGTVSNAVPDYTQFQVDVRYAHLQDKEIIEEQVKQVLSKTYIEGTHTKYQLKWGIPPMEQSEKNDTLFAELNKVYEENNLPLLTPLYCGGGADSAYESMVGTPVLCAVGVKGGRNHTPEEYALVDSIYERIITISEVITKLKI